MDSNTLTNNCAQIHMYVTVTYTIPYWHTDSFKQIQEEYNRIFKMDLFVLYKCSLLITAVTRVQFSNSTSTNETDMTPHTLNVLRGNHDAGIGPASPLSHNAGSDINLTSMVEQQRCRLEETCHHKKLSSCDFTGCQLETKLYLQGLGESKWLLGTLPENLNAFLPNLKVL